MEPLIITAALNGAEVTREQTPALPLTPVEIAEEAARARAAGAALVHIHARDARGAATQDPDVYREIIREIRERTDVIVQVSTGGAVGMTAESRSAVLALRPEMATLTTGTVNFGDDVFVNRMGDILSFAKRMAAHHITPEIEVFDVAMIENAMYLVRQGVFSLPLHFDFVLGVPGALSATARNLTFLVDALPQGCSWSVAGIGRAQLPMAMIGLAMGGHVRVGLEDNIYYSKGRLATGNAELVARVKRMAEEMGRAVASADEARSILGIARLS